MARTKNSRGVIVSICLRVSALILVILAAPICITANAAQISPKQRIERDFRQLEAALSRCMHEEVLSITELDGMNRTLHAFMQDNPGVVRIIRATVSGHTVNDVGAGSPHSMPPRNIGNQRWFKHVNQNRRAYHSMDRDSASGEIALFYAWPLMSGPERNRFSGAFAAIIDFTAQIALTAGLTENMPPFQINFHSRPIFQHDWDDLESNEESLDVSGAQGLTIRTHRPMPTRLDPVLPPPRTSASFEETENEQPESAAPPPASAAKRKTKKQSGFSALINTSILVLLIVIALMLAYSIKKSRDSQSKRFYIREDPVMPPPKPAQDTVVVKSMTEMVTPKAALIDALTANNTAGAAVNEMKMIVETTVGNAAGDNIDTIDDIKPASPEPANADPQVLNKMLKLIKSEFVIMDKKMAALSQRIEALEKNRAQI